MSTKAYYGLLVPDKEPGQVYVYACDVPWEMAHSWVANLNYELQRGVKRKKVKWYAEQMQKGEWLLGGQIVFVYSHQSQSVMLVQGQHRLLSQVEAQISVQYAVTIIYVQSDSEVGDLYAVQDRGASRTPYDQMHAMGVDDVYQWGKKETNKATSAVRFIAADFGSRGLTLSPQQTMNLLLKYGDAACDYFALRPGNVTESTRDVSLRSDIMAVGLVTLKYSSNVYGIEKVNAFWAKTFSGEMLAHNDPRMGAHKHLIQTYMSGRGAGKSDGTVMSGQKSSRILANYFKAWVEGRRIRSTTVNKKKMLSPILIPGSPYDGNATLLEVEEYHN